jgi:hypothetical protein
MVLEVPDGIYSISSSVFETYALNIWCVSLGIPERVPQHIREFIRLLYKAPFESLMVITSKTP